MGRVVASVGRVSAEIPHASLCSRAIQVSGGGQLARREPLSDADSLFFFPLKLEGSRVTPSFFGFRLCNYIILELALLSVPG